MKRHSREKKTFSNIFVPVFSRSFEFESDIPRVRLNPFLAKSISLSLPLTHTPSRTYSCTLSLFLSLSHILWPFIPSCPQVKDEVESFIELKWRFMSTLEKSKLETQRALRRFSATVVKIFFFATVVKKCVNFENLLFSLKWGEQALKTNRRNRLCDHNKSHINKMSHTGQVAAFWAKGARFKSFWCNCSLIILVSYCQRTKRNN